MATLLIRKIIIDDFRNISNVCQTFSSVVKPPKTNNKPVCDMIGPPDPISNIRPIRYAIHKDETRLEQLLRQQRQDVQTWNETFWTKHNKEFLQEKEAFKKREGKNLNAEEMSVFYKQFLDKNWRNHLDYNFSWYRKNIMLTFLHLRVKVAKLLRNIPSS